MSGDSAIQDSITHDPRAWDAVAESYQRVFAPVSTRFAEHALRLAGVEAGMRVLDVAAGSGAVSLAAARLGAEVVAVDFSQGMLTTLRGQAEREGLSTVTTVVMDGQALDFPEQSFDAVFSSFGLMFFPDRIKGFREMRRVLKPNGKAGIIVWSGIERLTPFIYFAQALEAAIPEFTIPEEKPAWAELENRELFAAEMKQAGFVSVAFEVVEKHWQIPSAAWLWENIQAISPAITEILEGLPAEHLAKAGQEFERAIHADHGTGGAELSMEALVAIANV